MMNARAFGEAPTIIMEAAGIGLLEIKSDGLVYLNASATPTDMKGAKYKFFTFVSCDGGTGGVANPSDQFASAGDVKIPLPSSRPSRTGSGRDADRGCLPVALGDCAPDR